MNVKNHKKLLNDAIGFFQLIAKADVLCEAGWEPEEAMDHYYIDDIKNLLIKWLPEEELIIESTEDCLKAEGLLENFFKNEILEIMNN